MSNLALYCISEPIGHLHVLTIHPHACTAHASMHVIYLQPCAFMFVFPYRPPTKPSEYIEPYCEPVNSEFSN